MVSAKSEKRNERRDERTIPTEWRATKRRKDERQLVTHGARVEGGERAELGKVSMASGAFSGFSTGRSRNEFSTSIK